MDVVAPLRQQKISIHAPRVGSDDNLPVLYLIKGLFQSTLPVWGATATLLDYRLITLYFNPRSPCGERPEMESITMSIKTILIHAPRVGSDNENGADGGFWVISIHAPRVGSDKMR